MLKITGYEHIKYVVMCKINGLPYRFTFDTFAELQEFVRGHETRSNVVSDISITEERKVKITREDSYV